MLDFLSLKSHAARPQPCHVSSIDFASGGRVLTGAVQPEPIVKTKTSIGSLLPLT